MLANVMISPRRWVALGAAAGLILAGCGDDTEDPAVTTEAAEAGPVPATSAAAGTTTPTESPTASTSASGDTGGDSAVHGATEDEIRIGITWLNYDSEFDEELGTELGSQAPGTGTEADLAQIVVDAINADGGIAGRQIVPVYYGYGLSSLFTASDRSEAEQAMCARFTEDHDVYAMMPYLATEGVITQCAADSETILVGTGGAQDVPEPDRLAEIGEYWYRPSWISPEHRDQALVDRLVANDFFGPDARVGLLIAPSAASQASVESTLKPALAEAGVEVASEVVFPDFFESPWNTYVQRFVADGVTHVLLSSCSGCVAGGFMHAAEDQGFHPKYGLTSEQQLGSTPEAVGGDVPAAQLVGSRAIGWYPFGDVAWASGADIPSVGPAHERCRAIFDAAGEQADVAPHFCEGLFFLQAVLENAEGLEPSAFQAAVESLGSSYDTVSTPATWFGPGQHSGAAAVRDIVFDDQGCECFAYEGDLHPIE